MSDLTSKEKTKKYKYGADELDLEHYMYNLDHNVGSYLDNLKWTPELKDEFRGAYKKYMQLFLNLLDSGEEVSSIDLFGVFTDYSKSLSESDNDGIEGGGSYWYNNKGERIDLTAYDALKDRKKKGYSTFNANKRVVTYLNEIGKEILKRRKDSPTMPIEKKKEKFNMSKHGAENYWMLKNSPTSNTPDLTHYIDRDKVGEDGKRAITNRIIDMANFMNDYKTYASETYKDYDFSDTPYKTFENFINSITSDLAILSDENYDGNDFNIFYRYGFTPAFTNGYFTREKYYNPSQETLQATPLTREELILKLVDEGNSLEEAELKVKVAERLLERLELDRVNEARRRLESLDWEDYYNDKVGEYSRMSLFKPINISRTFTEEDYDNAKLMFNNLLESDNKEKYLRETYLPLSDLLSLDINITDESLRRLDVWFNELLDTTKNEYKMSNGYYILPWTIDFDNNFYYAYNPDNAEYLLFYTYGTTRLPILFLDALKDFYLKNIRPLQYKKEGGIVHALSGIKVNYNDDFKLNSLDLKDKPKKKNYKYSSSVEDSSELGNNLSREVGNPLDETFTANDYVRLGALSADAGSLIASLIPGAGNIIGAGLGVSGTIANTIADYNDDISLGELATNTVTGLGADIIGLIPGFGVAGKAGKVTKLLVYWAPRLMALLLGGFTIANSDNIYNSLKKVGTDLKFTVDDWQNIYQLISTLATSFLFTSGLLKYKAATKGTKTGDKLVELKDGEMVKVTPELLEKILRAESLEKANEILKSIPGYENKEFGTYFKKIYNPKRIFNNNPSVADDYDFSRIREGNWGSDLDIIRSSMKNNWNLSPHFNFEIKNPYSKKYSLLEATQLSATVLTNLLPRYSILRELANQGVPSSEGLRINGEVSTEALNVRKIALTRRKEAEKIRAQREKEAHDAEVIENAKRAYEEHYRKPGKYLPAVRQTPSLPSIQTILAKEYPTVLPYRKKLPKKDHFKEYIESISPSSDVRSKSEIEKERRLKLSNYEEVFSEKSEIEKLLDYLDLKAEYRALELNSLPYESKSKIKRLKLKENKPKKQEKAVIRKTNSNKNYNNKQQRARVVRNQEGGLLQQLLEFKSGGILKGLSGLETPVLTDWYSDRFKFKSLKGFHTGLSLAYAGPSITNSNSGHFKASDLAEAKNKNQSYINNSLLVGSDIQNYYNNNFKGQSAENFITSYNSNIDKLTNYWNNEVTYKTPGALNHNLLFRLMYANRSDNSNKDYSIGYDEKLEDINGSSTWLRRPDLYEKSFEELGDEDKKSRIHKIDLGNGQYQYVYKKKTGHLGILDNIIAENLLMTDAEEDIPYSPKSGNVIHGEKDKEIPGVAADNKNIGNQILNNPTVTYGIPRAWYADRMNRRMTDLAKQATPLLKDSMLVHRSVYSDLDAEMLGIKNYADIMRLATRPTTSDGSLYNATVLEGAIKGLEFVNQGKLISNDMSRKMDELAWLQEKENTKNRYDAATFNRAQQWAKTQNDLKLEQAYLSKKHNIWDTLWKLFEYDKREQIAERKGLTDKYNLEEISNHYKYNLENYSEGKIDPKAIEVWNQVHNGSISTTELTDNSEYTKLYAQALELYKALVNNHYMKIKGIPSLGLSITNPNKKAGYDITEELIELHKKGGNLELIIEKIRNRSKNADRFSKDTLKHTELNEKALDRLAKTMYGIIKSRDLK